MKEAVLKEGCFGGEIDMDRFSTQKVRAVVVTGLFSGCVVTNLGATDHKRGLGNENLLLRCWT